MAASVPSLVADWRIRGSYFEACNCEAICPCRSVGGRPGGSSSFGECFGALSWHPALRWEVRGRRNAAFASDFDYRS